MKRGILWVLLPLVIIVTVSIFYGCTEREEDVSGSIYGTVTDFQTNEPIGGVNVKIRPSGEATLTGSDGSFRFQDLKPGQYSLSFSKQGYNDLDDDYIIVLESGKAIRRDVQMRKRVATLTITDASGNNIDTLDFGSETADVSRLFNIHNSNEFTIQWQIYTTAEWIQSVSASEGTLAPGNTKGIVVAIDRTKLQQGENTTTMHILSDNGNMQLTIKATRSDIFTMDASSVNGNSAVLNGRINTNANYSEKGFVYGTNHSFTERVVVNGNGTGTYSSQITNLTMGSTYYFKAYYISSGNWQYGEEKSFSCIPTFEYNGHTYMVAPDPGFVMTQDVASSYCEGLGLYGFSDWRLPTIEELLQMYADKDHIGGFDNTRSYWGSDYNGYWSFYVNFSSGAVGSAYRGVNPAQLYVRPIRVAQ